MKLMFINTELDKKGLKKTESIRALTRGAAMTEFLLIVFVLLTLNFAAWTLGIALLRYCMMVDSVTKVLRTASTTPTAFTGGAEISNCQNFVDSIVGIDGADHCNQSISYDLLYGIAKVSDPRQVHIEAQIKREGSAPVHERCRLRAELEWEIPCFFCHWFTREGWTIDNKIKVTASTFFEDPEFLYCEATGCSRCTSNPTSKTKVGEGCAK